MVFRDDRDALLAQADALRTQLADTEQKLEEARRVAADAKAAGLGGDDDDADEARLKKELARLREQVDSLREINAELREGVIEVDDAPPRTPEPAPAKWVTAPTLTAPSVPPPDPPPKADLPPPSPAAVEVFGSVIRGPAPELPPPGNPAMAFVAFLLILVVVAVFAALAFSG